MRRGVIALLIVPLLAVIAVAGGVTWLLYSNGGAHWLLGQAQDRVPGELRVERLDGSLAGGLRIGGLRYENAAMRLDAASLRVVLRAGFGPLTLRVRDLQADGVRYRIIDDGRPVEPSDPPGSLALPLPIEVQRFRVGRFSVEDAAGEQVFEGGLEARFKAFEQLDIEMARLESEPGWLDIGGQVGLAPPWRLALAASGELRAVIEGEDKPARLSFESEVDGPLDAYRFNADGSLAGGPLEEAHRFDLESSGSTARLQIHSLSVHGPTVRLESGALVDWTAQRLELTGLHAALPGSELEADADLTVDLATAQVAGEVSWREFAWPLRDAPPQLRSREGRATIGGSLDDWTVDGRADLVAEGVPPVDVQFRASGDRHALQAEIPEGAALGGTFGGRLTWSWEGKLPLSAALRFDGIETAALAPGWPGRLGGELALAGELEPLALDVDVARVQGKLRGADVFGEGRVRLAGRQLRFDGFTVRAGDSRVTLHGDANTAEGVAFELEVANPGALVPGADGRASGQGVVSLAGAWPRLSVDLEGAGLAWGEYRADLLTLSNVPVADDETRYRLELRGSGLAWNGRRLDSVNAVLEWNENEQVLELAAMQAPYGLTTRAAGRLENPDAPFDDWRWSGQLLDLDLSEEGFDGFRLATPVGFEAGARSARIDGACLESPAPARFCIAAEWNGADGAAGTVTLDHFPLDLAARRLDAGIEASQVISGAFGFVAPTGGAFSGEVELNLSPGALRYIDDPDVALETAEGYIGFSMADGRVSAGRLDVPMPGQGGIELDFEVARLADGADAPVSGRLRAELADLDVLTLLIPAVDRMAGRLQAEFDLAGTVGDPGIDGHIALSDGVVTNLASGFSLNDLQLSGEVNADRQTRLTGQFRAVDGVGSLTAVLDLRTLYDPAATLEIGGENLVLFDTPTLKLTATPDMRLGWRDGVVEIAGTLAIPQGRLEPKVIPMKPVGESADAEIVAGTLPERQLPEQSAPLDIQGSLDVTLGPGVTVKLPVAEANVSGNARFSWSGEPVPIGDGAYEVRGEILALGQLLEITDGTISFPGVRADNPHLNIQAEREIYGNSEIRHAGVLVAGTLRRPVIEPYTDPMTNRERARTLLVTGSDFNMERGVGTVDVGTYIAPRIFVSYGIGVFDQENVFSVRYDLGRGWGVKTTSGESQTGLDISYTVEN